MSMKQVQNAKNPMIESDDFFIFTLTKTREYISFVQNTEKILEYQSKIDILTKKKADLESENSKIIRKSDQLLD